MKWNQKRHLAKTILFLFLISGSTAVSQDSVKGVHELTLYAIPTMYPVLWDSPSTLYKTANRCFYKTLRLKDNYLLGHMALCLNSPLVPGKRYLAMTAADKAERVNLILKDKIGLSILGATLKGRIESEDHLLRMLQVYTDRQKIAFITFRISEAAMSRVLDFVQSFTRNVPGQVQPSRYYGGFYWPLFEDEGAGCSAFALGVLASASLLPVQANQWLQDVNIPIQLMGGEYRQNKRISFARILKTKSWYTGSGTANVDFVHVKTYDPSLLFEWILSRRSAKDSIFQAVDADGMPGLLVDCTAQVLPDQKPYFIKREESNLFLDVYQKKLQSHATQPTP